MKIILDKLTTVVHSGCAMIKKSRSKSRAKWASYPQIKIMPEIAKAIQRARASHPMRPSFQKMATYLIEEQLKQGSAKP